MSVQRTIPPEWYLTPTDKEIDAAVLSTFGASEDEMSFQGKNKGIELRNTPYDLIRDIAHVAAGGKTVSDSILITNVYDDVKDRKTRAFNGGWNRAGLVSYAYLNKRNESTRRSTDALALAIKREFNRQVRYHQNAVDFLREIDSQMLPGRTPLGKALALVSMMGKSAEENNHGNPSERTEDNDENLQNFDPGDKPKGKYGDINKTPAKDINEVMQGGGQMAGMSDAEQNLLESVSEIDPMDRYRNNDDKDFKDTEHFAIEDMQKVETIRNVMNNAQVWMDISGTLDKLANMAVYKRKEFTADPEGTEFRIRKMKGLGEIEKITKSEWALPDDYMEYRMLSKKSNIRERGKYVDKQQLLYIMIDSSGSMSYNENINKACGILFNRLKAVVEGDAEVYFRFFDTKLSDEYFAGDEVAAKEAMKVIAEHAYHGGGTKITECAKECLKRIDEIMTERNDLAVPELIIISDGIDDVSGLSANDFEAIGTKLHAFIIEYDNEPLTEIARQTGGVGVNKL